MRADGPYRGHGYGTEAVRELLRLERNEGGEPDKNLLLLIQPQALAETLSGAFGGVTRSTALTVTPATGGGGARPGRPICAVRGRRRAARAPSRVG